MASAAPARHTPADLLAITDRPMPELIDGELVEREPMGQISDAVAARILYLIYEYVRSERLGLVNGSQGSYQVFPDQPDKVRIPDVSFTSWERLPQAKVEEGHGRVAPDLVVEVISPNDKAVDVAVKIQDFLGAGVRLVWVVNPVTRDMQIHRADGTITGLKVGDNLVGEAVLPGFRCSVASLFDI